MNQERSRETTFRQAHQNITDELLRQWDRVRTRVATQSASDAAPMDYLIHGIEQLDDLIRKHAPALLGESDRLTGCLLIVLKDSDDVPSPDHPVLRALEDLTERAGIPDRFEDLSQAEERSAATKALVAGQDEGFMLSKLAALLAEEGRWEKLHELVAEGDGRQIWATHRFEWALSFDGYLSDVQWIYEHAQQELSPQNSTLRLQRLNRLLRYALIRASINSIVLRVPKELVVALVEAQVWSTKQALGYGRQITDEKTQGELVIALAPYLSMEERPIAISILTQVRHTRPSYGAGMLPANYFLRDYLQTTEIDARAFELCWNLLNDPAMRSDGIALLQAVGRGIAKGDDVPAQSLAQNSLSIISPDWGHGEQAAALLGVIPLLDMESLQFCVRNIAAGYYFLSSDQRDAVLAEIAVRVAKIGDGAFAADLVQTKISAAAWRSAALCRVSRICEADRKAELIRAAVHLDEMPIEALIAVLPVLGEELLFEQGVLLLLKQWYPKDGAWFIPQAAKDLSSVQQTLLFRHVLNRLTNDSSREGNRIHHQRALKELAPYLPGTLLLDALEICRSILHQIKAESVQFDPASFGFRGDTMLTGDSMTVSDFLGFMSASMTYSDYMDYVTAILTLVQRDIGRFLPDVLSMFEEIMDDMVRLDARTRLCPVLPAYEFNACLRAARSLASGLERQLEPAIKWQVAATALARLALQAPQSQRRALIAEALAAARAVKDRSRQQYVVTMIEISRILGDQERRERRGWLLEALESALGIEDRLDQVELLVDLLPHLTPEYQRCMMRPLLQLISEREAFPRRVKDSLASAAVQEDREQVLMKVLPTLAANGFYAEIQELETDFEMMSSERQQETIHLLKSTVPSTPTATIIERARRLLQEAEKNSKPGMDDGVIDPIRDPVRYQLVMDLSAQIDALCLLPRKQVYEQCKCMWPAFENLAGAENVNQLYTTVEKIGCWWP